MADGQHKRLAQAPSGESSSKRNKGEGEVAQGAGASRTSAAATTTRQTDPAAELPRVDISMEKRLLDCAVADCDRPLKPPIFKCEAGHFLCRTCRGDGGREGHCRRCDRATTFVHSPDMDTVVGAARMRCFFRASGCKRAVVYHGVRDHFYACPHAPSECLVPECTFTGSLPKLREHLRGAAHSWELYTVPGYGEPKPLSLTVSLPQPGAERRLLLAVEGDERRLFVMSFGAHGAWDRSVSVATVTALVAERGPRYTCKLWAQAHWPPGMAGATDRTVFMETEVPGCKYLEEVEAEAALWLRGLFRELRLRLRIDEAIGPVQPPSALLTQS